ncbi:uncharacterized protein BXZ73DRAFT_79061 [Epithele typhae]|uniref:uncharacterized protein n=1 Tax=Epithele typhae TaxID=378194 RepID=UPI002008E55D|nr:uncharacterized protein BXZ73DRAFT_79061 [Epithele typhae]KAH9925402.1 hypothetical protein BXZ73DRAFT_79061 [Epithele typhae]
MATQAKPLFARVGLPPFATYERVYFAGFVFSLEAVAQLCIKGYGVAERKLREISPLMAAKDYFNRLRYLDSPEFIPVDCSQCGFRDDRGPERYMLVCRIVFVDAGAGCPDLDLEPETKAYSDYWYPPSIRRLPEFAEVRYMIMRHLVPRIPRLVSYKTLEYALFRVVPDATHVRENMFCMSREEGQGRLRVCHVSAFLVRFNACAVPFFRIPGLAICKSQPPPGDIYVAGYVFSLPAIAQLCIKVYGISEETVQRLGLLRRPQTTSSTATRTSTAPTFWNSTPPAAAGEAIRRARGAPCSCSAGVRRPRREPPSPALRRGLEGARGPLVPPFVRGSDAFANVPYLRMHHPAHHREVATGSWLTVGDSAQGDARQGRGVQDDAHAWVEEERLVAAGVNYMRKREEDGQACSIVVRRNYPGAQLLMALGRSRRRSQPNTLPQVTTSSRKLRVVDNRPRSVAWPHPNVYVGYIFSLEAIAHLCVKAYGLSEETIQALGPSTRPTSICNTGSTWTAQNSSVFAAAHAAAIPHNHPSTSSLAARLCGFGLKAPDLDLDDETKAYADYGTRLRYEDWCSSRTSITCKCAIPPITERCLIDTRVTTAKTLEFHLKCLSRIPDYGLVAGGVRKLKRLEEDGVSTSSILVKDDMQSDSPFQKLARVVAIQAPRIATGQVTLVHRGTAIGRPPRRSVSTTYILVAS